jgi:drug/metabolite transporter (DMT)-like permease
VNPVVAVAIGHWLGGEALGIRTVLGTVLVLGSVVAIMTERTQGKSASRRVGESKDLQSKRG